MELNSNTNPLLKKGGTVLPKGQGGLSKKGGGLEKGNENMLGIKTYKKNKIWKVEDFDNKKTVVKPKNGEEEDDEEDDEEDEEDEEDKGLSTWRSYMTPQNSQKNTSGSNGSTRLAQTEKLEKGLIQGVLERGSGYVGAVLYNRFSPLGTGK